MLQLNFEKFNFLCHLGALVTPFRYMYYNIWYFGYQLTHGTILRDCTWQVWDFDVNFSIMATIHDHFSVTCLKLCPTWWTFKRRLRNRGHFLNTYNKNVFQPSLYMCTAAPSAQKKKKKTEKVDRSLERGKKKLKSILFISIYLFI